MNKNNPKLRLVLLFFTTILLVVVTVWLKPNLPIFDYVQYWSAGHLNAHGQNPYAPELLLQRQRLAGWQQDYAVMMWNPPWSLVLVMPFSYLPFRLGQVIWYFVELVLLIGGTVLLWQLYGGQKTRVWAAWFVALVFPPTLYGLAFGQITAWMFFGSVIFLWFINQPQPSRKTDFYAGLGLCLLAVKPHVMYLFWLALLFQALRQRRWLVLAGLAAGLAGGLALAMLFNPWVVTQYVAALFSHPPVQWGTPTLGYWLRVIFGGQWFGLQFLPPLLGLGWFGWWYLRRAGQVGWNRLYDIVMLASIVSAPYTWSQDQVLLLPGLLYLTVQAQARLSPPQKLLARGLWLLFCVVDVASHAYWPDAYAIWRAPLLIVVYLLATRKVLPAAEAAA